MLYLKYPINYEQIFNLLEKNDLKTITFFIDLQSIARGLYNRKVIELEIARYDESKEINTLPYELFEYVKKLNLKFKKYDPFFIIFYDSGNSRYHLGIDKKYKANRLIAFEDQMLVELFTKLKRLYFDLIFEYFNKYENCSVIYLKNYESDFVPYYIIKNNFLETNNNKNLNIILSTDKDMLQTTVFENTYQCITTYRKREYSQKIYDKRNCISFIYSRFKPGMCDASHIPLILSIIGDKSDNIEGIKGFGPKRAIDLIIKYKLNPDLSNIYIVEDIIDIELVKKNYKLISFEYLINNISSEPLNFIKSLL